MTTEELAQDLSRQQDFNFEDMMVHGAGDHPFAPEEDNGVAVAAATPEGAVASEQPELTPAEREAAAKEILEAEMGAKADAGTLVLEFGPFSRLDQQMRALAAEVVRPEFADAVLTHVRRTIHEVALSNPQLAREERSEDGLLARIGALQQLGAAMGHPEHPAQVLMAKLRDLKVPGVEELNLGMGRLVRLEQDRLERMTKHLAPLGAVGTIFHGLRRMMATPDGNLVGDARRHRNAELVTTLSDLKAVAAELDANAGNIEWERTQGVQSAQVAGGLRARIDVLTQGVEDQIDASGLRKGLEDVNKLLDSAKSASADEEHKTRLQELAKSVAEFMKQLAQTLGRLFGNSADSRSGPKPT